MARHRKLTQKFAGFPMFKLATGGDTYPFTSPFTSDFVGLDGLALDLQFAADKTLTARKGPTPAFTRGSSGRFVGSDGLIQSAGNNVARFDHDPVTLACKGLLIEEQRTNLLPRSEEFNDPTSWSPIRLVSQPTANTHVSPNGTMTAEKLTPSLLTGDHRIDRSSVPALIAGNAYTVSCFVKSDGYTGFGINVGSSPAPIGATFDLATGTVASTQAGWTASIQAYPNGWYRCSTTFTFSAGTRLYLYVGSTGTNFSYVGDETSGILIWGAQVELGAFATSYIPTTTAGLIRSADVCSITGSDFSGFYNPLEGSLSTSAIFNAPVANAITQLLVDVNDGTVANRLRCYRLATTGIPEFSNTSGNSLNVQIAGSTALQPFVTQKYSAGFKLNDYAFYVNNAQIGTDNLGAMIVSPTTMTIGDASAGAARFYTNGTISSIRYYKKRLPNKKLQAITV